MVHDNRPNQHGDTFRDAHPLSGKQERKQAKQHNARTRQYEHFGNVNWDAFEHRQLWDMIHSAKPETMYDKATSWASLSENISQVTGEVQQTVQNLLGTWRGSAAVQAADSNTKLTSWAGEVGEKTSHIGNGMNKYADAVTDAQTRMPEPVHYYAERWFREGYTVTTLPGSNGAYMADQLLDDHLPTHEEVKQAKSEAVRVMQHYESNSQDVHSKLPQYDNSPTFGTQAQQAFTPSAPGTGGGGGGQTPPPGVPGTGPGQPGQPSFPNPGSTSPSGAPLPNIPNIPGGGPGGPSSPLPGPNTTGPNLPGWPNGSGPNGGPLANGLGPFGGAGSGQGAAGLNARGAGAGLGPRSGPGGLSGAGALAAEEAAMSRSGAGAAAGRGGMGGMYPPMGGSGGGRGDGDGEHHNKYDDGLDLFDDVPPAYPSVFGA